MASDSQFRKLVSRNQDIAKLVEKGYAVTFDSGWMILRDIPYLDQHRELLWGAIATKLVPVDGAGLVTQEDHTILFAGCHPCGLDGLTIPAIDAGKHELQLSSACADVVVQRRFSNKPIVGGVHQGFANFFDKIESYVGIIAGPAMEVYPEGAKPLTFRSVEDAPEPSVFRYQDSLTSKAEISDLSTKLQDDIIAIIGLGGPVLTPWITWPRRRCVKYVDSMVTTFMSTMPIAPRVSLTKRSWDSEKLQSTKGDTRAFEMVCG